jgi:uncharacterized protein HemX
MEYVEKAQVLFKENTTQVAVGLLLVVVLVAVAWYYLGRKSVSNDAGVLENQARVNATTTDAQNEPPPTSTGNSQEELEKQLSSMGNVSEGQSESE